MPEKYYLTPEGLEKLKNELEHLITEKRQEIIDRIQEAVAHGDLSENADYAQAKEEQSIVEARIEEIQDMIKNAEIIHHTAGDTVSIGSTVKIAIDGSEFEYQIVGSNEAKPSEGRISNESLVGKAIMGRKEGDEVTVETPAGPKTYKVLQVQ